MDEQNVEQLRNTLIKLTQLETVIKSDKGFCEELIDIKMLGEFIKEQIPHEDPIHTTG